MLQRCFEAQWKGLNSNERALVEEEGKRGVISWVRSDKDIVSGIPIWSVKHPGPCHTILISIKGG